MNKKLLARHSRWIAGWILFGAMVGGCQTDPAASRQIAPQSSEESFDSLLRLQGIEQAKSGVYSEAPARHHHLFDYFKESNPQLIEHLEDLDRGYRSGRPHRGMTLIHAPGGMGKSYFIGEIDWPGEGSKLNLIKLSREFSVQAPDLASVDSSVVVNSLPQAGEPEMDALIGRIQATASGMVLLDDLDELHAETSQRLLTRLEAVLKARAAGFLHVLVFGRSESMGPWIRQRQDQSKGDVEITIFPLSAPDYQTWGDIEFRVRDYYQFLRNEEVPQWVAQDVKTQLGRFPFLREFIRPLSWGNYVFDDSIARYPDRAEGEFLEFQLKQRLFEDLLRRNQRSHGRPGPEDIAYQKLLFQAALFPLKQGRPLDDQGYFDVSDSDTVQRVDPNSGVATEFRLSDVLDRSGLVVMDLNSEGRRYRFEPLWVQRHLMTRRSGF